jgi:hypothetical protein
MRIRAGRARVPAGYKGGHRVVGIDPDNSDLVRISTAAVAARGHRPRHRSGGNEAKHRRSQRQREDSLPIHLIPPQWLPQNTLSITGFAEAF